MLRARIPLVCPAHAGIDLSVISSADNSQRLPRTRGDRPNPDELGLFEIELPRTRGDRPSIRMKAIVCPAHAGIDPERQRKPAANTVCPAHAGIDPNIVLRQVAPHTRPVIGEGPLGCPAHVGIDPCMSRFHADDQTDGASLSLPRTRGDRPHLLATGTAPHTWG